MSSESKIEEQKFLEEWYELKPNFRVECRQVSCKTKEILHISCDKLEKHMKDVHQKIAICEEKTVEKAKSEIRYPGSNNWKCFKLWEEPQSLLLEDLQSAPEMAQYSIMCILCFTVIRDNNQTERDKHIIENHPDIENEYRERYISDFWPCKYQTKLRSGFDLDVKCNHCGNPETLELPTESLKKHYEENHKEIWEKKFKQEEAHDQPGPSAGPRQPPGKETLQAKFEEHSWMKEYFEQLPYREFRVKCLIESCQEVLLYVTNQKFIEHMKDKHKKIHDLEIKKSQDFSWTYFIQNEQGERKCLICAKIVTNESPNNHIEKHISKDTKGFYDNHKKYFKNLQWAWKYMKQTKDFVAKCKLCTVSDIKVWFSSSLKRHCEMHLMQESEATENILKQREAHDQPGPSAGPRQPPRKETLQAKLEEHRMKEYFKHLPYRKFRVKCLRENCKEVLLYVTNQKFMEHMETEHKKIYDFESKKKESNDLHWAFFMQNEQEKIECLICTKIVTEESADNHVKIHKSNDPKFYHTHKDLINLKSWSWKYMEQAEDFLAKCKLCEVSDIKVWFSSSLKRHCEMHLMQESKAAENILKPRKAHDQAGPSTQPLENRKDRTLKSEFEKHSWLKICYEYQPDSYFCVKCLAETCEKRYVLYVDIKNFAEHMRTNHITICELEDERCSRPDVDDNWIYFMHREQGEIECVICDKIVTSESTKNHIENHIFNLTNDIKLINYFINIKKNWIWKYQKESGDYIGKCRLCKEDSSRIHLTPDTTNLKNHYINMHKDKWEEMEHISKQEEMQEQTGPSRKLKKTS